MALGGRLPAAQVKSFPNFGKTAIKNSTVHAGRQEAAPPKHTFPISKTRNPDFDGAGGAASSCPGSFTVGSAQRFFLRNLRFEVPRPGSGTVFSGGLHARLAGSDFFVRVAGIASGSAHEEDFTRKNQKNSSSSVIYRLKLPIGKKIFLKFLRLLDFRKGVDYTELKCQTRKSRRKKW